MNKKPDIFSPDKVSWCYVLSKLFFIIINPKNGLIILIIFELWKSLNIFIAACCEKKDERFLNIPPKNNLLIGKETFFSVFYAD